MIAANSNTASATAEDEEYVTVMVADQMLGLPIGRVHDVFIPSSLTAVPLAPPEVVGLINLRGRVVTAICLRRRLGLPERPDAGRAMAVGLENRGESYGLLVDEVGDVIKLAPETCEPNPVHLDSRWSKLSGGVHRLKDKLLIICDVDAVLSFDAAAAPPRSQGSGAKP